ncbi:methyltransferase domain-containing protein [Cytophaga hutchinsonii]|jgi:SAM-dependent methyltransferase|nr:methyltransferase domain-containing protein [Cytophaga hutchinsonii]SFX00102.1 Methyltransferase domain-containing protein [Cytophaga hutchinsonii ATCC 33406]
MIIDQLRIQKNIPDEEFDAIYPFEIRELSERHWTSVFVAKTAADFLCNQRPVKVLDIGSGAGKFCFVGAALHPSSQFHGIDIRENFIQLSNNLKEQYAVANVSFFQQDALEMDLTGYGGIYFFNSFQEKIDPTSVIDHNSKVSVEQYIQYTNHIFNELNKVPAGTKLVTYYSEDFCVPGSFRLLATHFNGELKFYLKEMEPDESDEQLNQQDISEHIDRHTFLSE